MDKRSLVAVGAVTLLTREAKMDEVTSDRWLSVDEIAGYLGVKRYTIYKWIERKNMPAHKVGSLWNESSSRTRAW